MRNLNTRITQMFCRSMLVLACTGLLSAAPCAANFLPVPKTLVVLTISEEISVTNVAKEARFDIAMLEALGVAKVVTPTPWTEGDITFEGVWARDLAKAVGATGKTVIACALNDYRAEIPGIR